MATSSTTSRRQRAVVTVLLPLLLACLGPPAYTHSLPGHGEMHTTNFSCIGKVIGGYYADQYTNCQMFHVCTLDEKGKVNDYTFKCLAGTVFDQETRVCERAEEVDCSRSESFFHLNNDLYGPGIIPSTANITVIDAVEETATLSRTDSSTPTPDHTTTTTTTSAPPFEFPVTSFTCIDKIHGGLYADVETGCKVFHICSVKPDKSVKDNKFVCGPGTLFNQKSRTCQVESAVDCLSAPSFYYLNDRGNPPDVSVDLCTSRPQGTPLADITSGCVYYSICEKVAEGRVVEKRHGCKKGLLFSQLRKRCVLAKKVECVKETLSEILGLGAALPPSKSGRKRRAAALLSSHRFRRAALQPLVNMVATPKMEDAQVRRVFSNLAALQQWTLENAQHSTFIELYSLTDNPDNHYPKKTYDTPTSPELSKGYEYSLRRKRDITNVTVEGQVEFVNHSVSSDSDGSVIDLMDSLGIEESHTEEDDGSVTRVTFTGTLALPTIATMTIGHRSKVQATVAALKQDGSSTAASGPPSLPVIPTTLSTFTVSGTPTTAPTVVTVTVTTTKTVIPSGLATAAAGILSTATVSNGPHSESAPNHTPVETNSGVMATPALDKDLKNKSPDNGHTGKEEGITDAPSALTTLCMLAPPLDAGKKSNEPPKANILPKRNAISEPLTETLEDDMVTSTTTTTTTETPSTTPSVSSTTSTSETAEGTTTTTSTSTTPSTTTTSTTPNPSSDSNASTTTTTTTTLATNSTAETTSTSAAPDTTTTTSTTTAAPATTTAKGTESAVMTPEIQASKENADLTVAESVSTPESVSAPESSGESKPAASASEPASDAELHSDAEPAAPESASDAAAASADIVPESQSTSNVESAASASEPDSDADKAPAEPASKADAPPADETADQSSLSAPESAGDADAASADAAPAEESDLPAPESASEADPAPAPAVESANITSTTTTTSASTSTETQPSSSSTTPATTTTKVEETLPESVAEEAAAETASDNITTTSTSTSTTTTIESVSDVVAPSGSINVSTTVVPDAESATTNTSASPSVTEPSVTPSGPFTSENLPETNFTCKDKKLEQFYPDPEANCQVFHYCLPGFQKKTVLDLKFLCTGATKFDVKTQKCEDMETVTCGQEEDTSAANTTTSSTTSTTTTSSTTSTTTTTTTTTGSTTTSTELTPGINETSTEEGSPANKTETESAPVADLRAESINETANATTTTTEAPPSPADAEVTTTKEPEVTSTTTTTTTTSTTTMKPENATTEHTNWNMTKHETHENETKTVEEEVASVAHPSETPEEAPKETVAETEVPQLVVEEVEEENTEESDIPSTTFSPTEEYATETEIPDTEVVTEQVEEYPSTETPPETVTTMEASPEEASEPEQVTELGPLMRHDILIGMQTTEGGLVEESQTEASMETATSSSTVDPSVPTEESSTDTSVSTDVSVVSSDSVSSETQVSSDVSVSSSVRPEEDAS